MRKRLITPGPRSRPSSWVGISLVLFAGLAGCDGPGEPAVVARSGEWTLTVSRLADLLVLAQPFPLEVEPAADLARHWIAAAAMAQRAAAGASFAGDEAVEASTWLERREALMGVERRDRLGDATGDPPDVVFSAGEVRLVAHVLRQVGPETPPAEKDLQRRTADRILAALVRGGSWDDAVAESEDIDTRGSAGLLGLFGPGELPPDLDRATFRLLPGQVSSVVESPLGFHILYRPRYEDVADLFASRLWDRRLIEADQAANDRVLADRHAVRDPDGPALLRRMARQPRSWLASENFIVSWDDGGLTEGTVAHYLAALRPGARSDMTSGSDAALADLLDDLAIRELRVRDARSRGLALDDAMAARLRAQHESEIEEWFTALGIAEGAVLERGAVDRHMDELVARQRTAPALPLLFEVWLLDGVAWSLSDPGVEGAVARARSMLEGASR